MIGVYSIIFEKNDSTLIISINNESTLKYKDISKRVDNSLIFNYLESLFSIIDGWEKEYIDITTVDGASWKLSINYIDGSKLEYSGKSNYPSNFEAFERLNQNLINEVQNG